MLQSNIKKIQKHDQVIGYDKKGEVVIHFSI